MSNQSQLFIKWVNALQYITSNGYLSKNRGFLECLNLSVQIAPQDSLIESLLKSQDIEGVPTEKACTEYSDQLIFGKPVEGVEYTYGQRLTEYFRYNQIYAVIDKIINYPDSTSLYLSLWDVHTDYEKDNPPCLTSIWFRCRNNQLDMFCTFRSHDIYRAWLLNTVGLINLQKHIADYACVQVGFLNVNSLSAHIYQDCLPQATSVVNDYFYSLNKQKEFDDPIGNFVIEKDGKEVIASLYREKTLVASYRSVNPQKVIDDIITFHSGLQPSHAAYLVKEVLRYS